MLTLNIIANFRPVGPINQLIDAQSNKHKQLFSLQLSAGYSGDLPTAEDDFRSLATSTLPWHLLGTFKEGHNPKISVCALRKMGENYESKYIEGELASYSNEGPISEDSPIHTFAREFERAHIVGKTADELNIQWTEPSTNSVNNDDDDADFSSEKVELSSLAMYGSTLPPPLTGRLRWTLYFFVDLGDDFFSGGDSHQLVAAPDIIFAPPDEQGEGQPTSATHAPRKDGITWVTGSLVHAQWDYEVTLGTENTAVRCSTVPVTLPIAGTHHGKATDEFSIDLNDFWSHGLSFREQSESLDTLEQKLESALDLSNAIFTHVQQASSLINNSFDFMITSLFIDAYPFPDIGEDVDDFKVIDDVPDRSPLPKEEGMLSRDKQRTDQIRWFLNNVYQGRVEETQACIKDVYIALRFTYGKWRNRNVIFNHSFTRQLCSAIGGLDIRDPENDEEYSEKYKSQLKNMVKDFLGDKNKRYLLLGTQIKNAVEEFLDVFKKDLYSDWPYPQEVTESAYQKLIGRLEHFRSALDKLSSLQLQDAASNYRVHFQRQQMLRRVRQCLRRINTTGSNTYRTALENQMLEDGEWLSQLVDGKPLPENISRVIQRFTGDYWRDSEGSQDKLENTLPRGLLIQYGLPTSVSEGEKLLPEEKIRELSGVGLLIRREGEQGWRVANVGRLTIPKAPPGVDEQEWFSKRFQDGNQDDYDIQDLVEEPVIIPLRIAFQSSVNRPQLQYLGAPIGIDDSLASANRGYTAKTILPNSNESHKGLYEGASLFAYRAWQGSEDRLRPPALVYGETYESCIYATGTSGGLPLEMSLELEACVFKPNKLVSLIPPDANTIAKTTYLRKVSVGPVAISKHLKEEKANWHSENEEPLALSLINKYLSSPTVSANTSEINDGAKRTTPSLMLSVGEKYPGFPAEINFDIGIPQIAVEVFNTWSLPRFGPTYDAAQAKAKLELVKAVYTKDLINRNVDVAKNVHKKVLGVNDPAVLGIGMRVFWFDEKTKTFQLETNVGPNGDGKQTMLIANEQSNDFFRRNIPVSIKVVQHNDRSSIQTEANSFTVTVPDNAVGFIEFHPLLSRAGLKRFDAAVIADLLSEHRKEDFEPYEHGSNHFGPLWFEHDTEPDESLFFLPGNMVAFETVVDTLPSEKQLFDSYSLVRRGQTIANYFDPQAVEPGSSKYELHPFRYVKRFEILRQHWVWRSRPFAGKSPDDNTYITDEFGTPPKPLWGKDIDHAADESTKQWESIVELSDSMIGKTIHHGLWPLESLDTAWTTDVNNKILLHLDKRQDQTPSAYHRYALGVSSRYEQALKYRSNSRTFSHEAPSDKEKDAGDWRRIFMPHRGNRPNPPSILAVLPLTKGMPGGLPVDHEIGNAAPVLVVVDHIPFKEFGMTERLQATLVPDVVDGEQVDKPPVTDESSEFDQETELSPLRVGPLGDVYLPPNQDDPYWGTSQTRDVQLKIWGPFAYTFDQTAESALPSCAAYLVYPPKDAGPHWIASVSFQRVIAEYEPTNDGFHFPEEFISASSGVKQLYFKASSTVDTEQDRDKGRDRTITNNDILIQNESLEISESFFEKIPPLSPSNAGPVFFDIPDRRGQDPFLSHRYFFLICEAFYDTAANETVDVPIALYGISPDKQTFLIGAPDFNIAQSHSCRILEVRTHRRSRWGDWEFDNAKWDDGSPIQFVDFWRYLLPFREDQTEQLNKVQAVDLPDARGVIERIFDPFSIEVRSGD